MTLVAATVESRKAVRCLMAGQQGLDFAPEVSLARLAPLVEEGRAVHRRRANSSFTRPH
jgi:hypothetical protein